MTTTCCSLIATACPHGASGPKPEDPAFKSFDERTDPGEVTLSHLLSHRLLTIEPTTSIPELETMLLQDPSLLSVLVIERDSIGIIERGEFLTFPGGPLGYGRLLHGRKRVTDYPVSAALVLADDVAVADAASATIERRSHRWAESIVVRSQDGSRRSRWPRSSIRSSPTPGRCRSPDRAVQPTRLSPPTRESPTGAPGRRTGLGSSRAARPGQLQEHQRLARTPGR